MYVSGMIADISSYNKHKNNIYYNSLGASGATSAVLFSLFYSALEHALYNYTNPAYFWRAIFGTQIK